MRILRRLAVVTLATLGLAATPAIALPTCGSLGQPVCVEAPPPGVELQLTAEENPKGLQPLSVAPSPTRPLWPRVRGHEPYGLNSVAAGTDGTTVEDEAMLNEQAGASLARLAVEWGAVQYWPNAADGGTPWNYAKAFDDKYRAYVRRGIRPLLNVLKAPRRFTRNAQTPRSSYVVGCGTSDNCHNPPLDKHLGRLAIFAADLAKRYPLAAGIQVWNEPNLSNPFWGGEPVNPERYAKMLRTVHDAVKKVRPAMPVIGGSLAAYSTTTTATDPAGAHMALRTFLARMLVAGASDEMDAVSFHPYLGPYPTYATTQGAQDKAIFDTIVAQDRAVLDAYADAGRPLTDRVVATEFGASTTNGYTEERQAAWLRLRYWLWDTDHPYMPLPVDAAFLHRAVEHVEPGGLVRPRTGYGLTRPKDGLGRFASKPVFCAFRVEFGGYATCPDYLT